MRFLTVLLAVLLPGPLAWAESNPASFFEAPVALSDASGAPLLTSKAQGCPTAADFNGDGKIDLILGAKDGMDTATGGIWLIPNKGTNAKPAFSWADAQRVTVGGAPLNVGCG